MNERQRPAPTPPTEQTTTHPETKKHVRPGSADEKSSKAVGSERDARTGHDKDGNEEPRKSPG